MPLIVAPTMTAQVRDIVYYLGQQSAQNNVFDNGIVVSNSSGTVSMRVILSDGGTSLILVKA